MEIKKQATLKIYFCYLLDKSYFNMFFDEFNINGISIPTSSEIELSIDFTELESFLGKKVCSYELIRHKKNEVDELKINGGFQIYEGSNVAFCFIDIIGVTFELIFLSDTQTINEFINKNLEISTTNVLLNHKMEISLNKLQTEDRANIILINCPNNSIITDNNNLSLSVQTLINSVDKFSASEGYQFCFTTKDLKEYVYKKIESIEELNFVDIYNKYNEKVSNLYTELIHNNEIDIEEELKKKK